MQCTGEFECTLFSCNLQTPHSHYKVVVFLPACCLCEQQVGRPDNHLRDPFSEVHFNLSDLITVGNRWKVKSPRFECGGGGNILERLSFRMVEEIWKSENHRVVPYWLHKILCKFLFKWLCETGVGSYTRVPLNPMLFMTSLNICKLCTGTALAWDSGFLLLLLLYKCIHFN